jgi:general secretion pathway protein K
MSMSASGRLGARGVALVTVLWVLALLVVMAAAVTANSRTDVEMARNLLDTAKARLAAESAIRLVILDMLRGSDEGLLYGSGAVVRWEIDGLPVEVAVFDEAGRIDLNGAPRVLLDGLMIAAGVAGDRREAVVDAILDWRDPDDLRRLAGAEDRDYESAGRGYGSRDEDFQSVEELRLVLGVDQAVFERIAPALTVYSGSGGVSLDVASPLVAAAGERSIEGGESGDALTSQPASAQGGSSGALRRSGTFTIYAQGRTPGGARAAVAATVSLGATRGELPYTIRDWRDEPAVAERLFGSAEQDETGEAEAI